MATQRKHIKVTYSSLASPDPLLHEYYDEDVAKVREMLGQDVASIYINGEWRRSEKSFTKSSPIDHDMTIGTFYEADTAMVDEAIAVAKATFNSWRNTPWQERVALIAKVAELVSERLFEISAVLSLEIGKNRLEAIGEVEEAADILRYAVEAINEYDGFQRGLANESDKHHNTSVLKPYGVWGIIAPFNFPAALSIGPAGNALIAGNTVVCKPADDAPLTAYMLTKCFEDAGVPAGVYNVVTGGDEPGKALVANLDIEGLTFTGSYAVGMSILKNFSTAKGYLRPVITEMGGKNPAFVGKSADLDKAALGVMRSAFGLSGQKCSACSRVFVHEDVQGDFTKKLLDLTNDIKVGDPTNQDVFMGPVVNEQAYRAYQNYVEELSENGDILTGGKTLDGNGYYVAPTIVANLDEDHHLWKDEMFLPIVTMAAYSDNDATMTRANDINLGLTAGIYSEDKDEINWFLNNMQAGVLYVNRAAGATTGAWPGYQAFGGWKGSTGTNKGVWGYYYLQQYMREQSQTIVD